MAILQLELYSATQLRLTAEYLNKLADAQEGVSNAVIEALKEVDEPVPTPAAARKKKPEPDIEAPLPAEEHHVEAPAPAPVVQENTVQATLEDVRSVFGALLKENRGAEVKAVLKEFGVEKASELPPSSYNEIVGRYQ